MAQQNLNLIKHSFIWYQKFHKSRMIFFRNFRFNFWYDVKNFTSSGDIFKGLRKAEVRMKTGS